MSDLVDYLRDKLEHVDDALVPAQVGFLVTGDWCDRCGDQNYDGETRVCLTCTYPDDPCSRAYLEGL